MRRVEIPPEEPERREEEDVEACEQEAVKKQGPDLGPGGSRRTAPRPLRQEYCRGQGQPQGSRQGECAGDGRMPEQRLPRSLQFHEGRPDKRSESPGDLLSHGQVGFPVKAHLLHHGGAALRNHRPETRERVPPPGGDKDEGGPRGYERPLPGASPELEQADEADEKRGIDARPQGEPAEHPDRRETRERRYLPRPDPDLDQPQAQGQSERGLQAAQFVRDRDGRERPQDSGGQPGLLPTPTRGEASQKRGREGAEERAEEQGRAHRSIRSLKESEGHNEQEGPERLKPVREDLSVDRGPGPLGQGSSDGECVIRVVRDEEPVHDVMRAKGESDPQHKAE